MTMTKVKDASEFILENKLVARGRSGVNGTNLPGQRLKATWEGPWEPGVDEPSKVTWEDGRPATLEDFHVHEVDTHFWAENDDGRVSKFMFPDIVADVVFDQSVKDWVVQGPGVITTALALTNPNAPDADIIAALHTLTTVYRSRIIR